eukprot:4349073-Amphidinium_carterae.2
MRDGICQPTDKLEELVVLFCQLETAFWTHLPHGVAHVAVVNHGRDTHHVATARILDLLSHTGS